MTEPQPVAVAATRTDRTAVLATVTPLASIFGSGFLIIVPVLEAGFGGRAWAATGAVCLLAFVVGSAVRHNIRFVEARSEAEIGRGTIRLRTLAAAMVALAYAVSVGLYLQIMGSYAYGAMGIETEFLDRITSTAIITVLVAVGVRRGFAGLSAMESLALGVTLVMIVAMTGAFAFEVAGEAGEPGGLGWPAATNESLFAQAALLGGILISVQGFETSRYLGAEYDKETRIRTSRWSQYIASAVYVGFVLICTPLMATATPGAEPDGTRLDLVQRTVPFLAIPLALTGVFSQFSAAIADLVTAVGNGSELSAGRIPTPALYVGLGALAISVVWLFSTFALVAVASRAFAAFYFVQCIIAARTARRRGHAAGFLLLAAAMLFIVVFARPVG